MAPCRLVVLISGSGSNLQAIIDACGRGEINADIAAVISNKADAYGLERAKNAGIQTRVLSHKDFDSREAYDAELMDIIDSFEPNLVVLAGFMRILTPNLVQKFKGKMLNIHPSLLPKYQGLNTHQRAIDAKDDVHGVSVHFVTEELDGGPVVLQAKVPVLENDTAETLAQRVHQQEHIIYPLVVKWFSEQRLKMEADYAVFDEKQLPAHGAHYPE
ncbi:MULTISPECIES: phosphoribosylglycinamide formyltransferase [Pseudoalteromonas]|jgi:phosphoribosylglycinamide formyltransferase-1|uniref:Phosphoribosylglycinamide formyltransferase n=1 Tax=Pseudoalteromonas lipolytica TaxID=570156 RepID=A0AAD0RZ84_9GAMM|nr:MULTISPECIES: phosphoribosylglycinamide formyltransferase [Pseudoalteromonas]AXV64947.1 phosphoribosylglycinamide formyltransferase [Pseudoalteromonas donghaensis]MAE01707.1 phosphoribosylglycinamide formyltransferase [Pseudoalteromonas sp.]QMW15653.1 phosphoribosylglycinamide formyltransferase [Pseudoalteromonas sp. MT33b]QPL44036.1 phosphoribosylglycinamide formyltransferase [Pseudoalteromonas sp. A41-2]|tara:strand:- start:701 stop:1348 length:648 start_codon:yes stop_codon:yes gene_type:complete